jgi:TonB family protein
MPKEFFKSLFLAIGLHGVLLGTLIFLWPFWTHSIFSLDRYRIYKISLVGSPRSFQSTPKEAKKMSSSERFETSKKADIRAGSALLMPQATPFLGDKSILTDEDQAEKKEVGPEISFSLQVSPSENPSSEKRGGGKDHQTGNNKEALVSLSSGTGFAPPSVLAVPRYGRNRELVYPAMAREQGWQGTTLLKVQVLKNGLVGSLEVLRSSGFSILDQSALKGVKEWKFIPAQKDGQPIEIGVEIPVTFRLE